MIRGCQYQPQRRSNLVPSDLLCRGTQELFLWRSQWLASHHGSEDFTDFHPIIFMFTEVSLLRPFLLHSHTCLSALGIYTGSQPRPLWLHKCNTPAETPMPDPVPYAYLGPAPPALPLYLLSLTPVIGLHCCEHYHRKTLKQQECMTTARPLQPAVCCDGHSPGHCTSPTHHMYACDQPLPLHSYAAGTHS